MVVAKNLHMQARDHPVLQNSEQSSSGNQEISTNFSVALAKNSVTARYDPMIRWKTETPEEEPWSALGQFPENQASLMTCVSPVSIGSDWGMSS